MNVDSPGDSRTFVNSNVWLYALIAKQDQAKSELAREIISHPRIVSVQVVNEVCVNLLRKGQRSEDEIDEVIRAFHSQHDVEPLDENVLLRAGELRRTSSLSFWDSLIVSAALTAGATVLYSEDLQHQQLIDGSLRIINPFLESLTLSLAKAPTR